MNINIPYVSYLNKLTLNQRILAAVPLIALAFLFRRQFTTPTRQKKIPPNEEHVLILGASSGVGRSLAIQYAKRGARVCLVARNEDGLEIAQKECLDAAREQSAGKGQDGKQVFSVVADFSNAEDMVRVREKIQAGESV